MSALRELIARFNVQVDAKPLEKASTMIDAVKSGLSELGGALAGGALLLGLKNFATGLLHDAYALAKQSRALGLSLAEMQAWSYVAELGGASAEDLTNALSRIGAGKFDEGIAALGVATKDAAGHMRGSTAILDDVADKLKAIENPTERNHRAAAALGKNYAKLLPVLEGGSEGLKSLRKEFDELGGGFDKDFAKNAEEVNDNFTRLKVTWKAVAITALAQIMPMLRTLSQRFVQIARPLGAFIKNTKLLQAVAVGAAIKGIALLSKALGPLHSQFLKTILPLLIFEDFLVFLAVGKSAFGATLDAVFGSGTQEKIRGFADTVLGEFKALRRDAALNPQKLKDDWELFTKEATKDASLMGAGVAISFRAILGTYEVLVDALTGGFPRLWGMIKVGWQEVTNAILQDVLAVQGFLFEHIAAVQDAFTALWNGILSGAQKALGLLSKGASLVPGGGDTAQRIQHVIQSLESSKGAGDAVERVRNVVGNQQRLAANAGTLADARWNALRGGPPVDQKTLNAATTINVNVPPGTSRDAANDIARAVDDRMGAAMRRANAALTGGG